MQPLSYAYYVVPDLSHFLLLAHWLKIYLLINFIFNYTIFLIFRYRNTTQYHVT
jgi:hypothetical protein